MHHVHDFSRLGGALHRAESSGLPWLTVSRLPSKHPVVWSGDLHWLGHFPATNMATKIRSTCLKAYFFIWYFPIETPSKRAISGLLKNQKVCVCIYIYTTYWY